MVITDVILDFGHGGVDLKGRYTTAPKKMFTFPNGEKAYEGVLNRQIGKKVYEFLRWDINLKVHTTVDFDDPSDISLKDRINFVNRFDINKTLLVSIHSNAYNTKIRGFEIYTNKEQTLSDILAEYIFKSVEIFYNKISLKVRPDRADGDSDKEADFYVLDHSKCPAVLIECLYFDNIDDFKMLKNQKFQIQLAYHIYLGIRNFINSTKNV